MITIKEKINILSKNNVIDILLAIHNGFDRAGKVCDKSKELRTQFSEMKYDNFRRIMTMLLGSGLIFGKGSVVDRQYFIDYKQFDINIFH